MKIAKSIDEYVGQFPSSVRQKLEEVRKIISMAAPDAVETISYAMPTFRMKGKNLVHFAGYEKHIGFYPTPSAIEAFKEQVSKYKWAKGSVQFPMDEELPRDLIRKMVEYRVEEMGNGKKK